MNLYDSATLKGRVVRLEPLGQQHCADLAEAVQDGQIWRLWVTQVPAPEEMAALLNGERVPRAALMAAIERWNAGGDWPTSLGGPPRRHGCALPEAFLAMCVEAT